MVLKKVVLLALVFFSAFIYAGEGCLVLDEGKDSLSADERKNATVLFETILAEKGVVSCDKPYELYHLKLGNKIVVVVKRGEKVEKLHVDSIEELSKAYDRIIDSVTKNKSLAADEASRKNVLAHEARTPKKVSSEPFFYAKLGYGGIVYDGIQSGILIGLGLRFELDRFALDFSSINGVFQVKSDSDDDEENKSYEILRISGLYYFMPENAHSFYVGTGVAWGAVKLYDDHIEDENWGASVSVTAGYEMFRNSDIRLFFNGEVSLPTFKVGGEYAPSFSISAGAGF